MSVNSATRQSSSRIFGGRNRVGYSTESVRIEEERPTFSEFCLEIPRSGPIFKVHSTLDKSIRFWVELHWRAKSFRGAVMTTWRDIERLRKKVLIQFHTKYSAEDY